MHYFALRKNDAAIAELLRVGGCMCIRNHAGQNAIDVRKNEELRMLDDIDPKKAARMRLRQERKDKAEARGELLNQKRAEQRAAEREMALKREQRKKAQEDSVDISTKKSKAEQLQEEAQKALAEAAKQDAAFKRTQSGGGFFGSMMKTLSSAGRPQSANGSESGDEKPVRSASAGMLPSLSRGSSGGGGGLAEFKRKQAGK